MNFGDGNVDGNGLLAGLHFLLVAAIPKIALDFNVSAFGEFGGRIGQLAPEHDTVPLGAALVRASFVLPAAFSRQREGSDGGAVGV